MKQIFSLLIFACVAICAAAAPPNLACEAIFNRKELRTEGHKLVKITEKDTYYRCAKGDADPQLRDEVVRLVREDMKRSASAVESCTDGVDRIVMVVKNNGENINIGLRWDDKGYFNLFVEGPPKAFE